MAYMCCPVCEGEEFADFRGRPLEECVRCRSKARARSCLLVMRAAGVFDEPERDILHLAPERGLARVFAKRFGAGYDARDFDPTRYDMKWTNVSRFDLCHDVAAETKRFDCILHNHVLEHVPCNVLSVVSGLDRLLKPGGIHIFTVPIAGPITNEDLSPDVTPEERLRRFKQADHMRMFGNVDFPNALLELRGAKDFKFPLLSRYTKKDLERYGVPVKNVTGTTGATVFYYRAPS